MTDKATHTPLPWTIDKYGAVLRDGQTIVTEGFALSGSALAKQNTAFIVHAVNSHHDLIEALREAREALCNHACHGGKEAPCIRSDDQCRAECGYLAGDAIVRIDSILTKAEAS